MICYTLEPASNAFSLDSPTGDIDETSSLVSYPGDVPDHERVSTRSHHHSHKPDVTGWALVRNGNFWKLWILLGLLCGVGLMTIK